LATKWRQKRRQNLAPDFWRQEFFSFIFFWRQNDAMALFLALFCRLFWRLFVANFFLALFFGAIFGAFLSPFSGAKFWHQNGAVSPWRLSGAKIIDSAWRQAPFQALHKSILI
jgi:hypothetical protein